MPDTRSHHRKKLYVDRNIQWALVRRVLLYWLSCVLFVTIPVAISRTLANPDRLFHEHVGQVWEQHWPVFVTTLIMLPFLTYDIIRFSHRFVGPLVRLRREMEKMAAGQRVEPLAFREHDYWPDLATSFSKIVDRFQQTPPAAPTLESPPEKKGAET